MVFRNMYHISIIKSSGIFDGKNEKKNLDISFQIGLLIYFGVAIDKQIHVSLLHAKNKNYKMLTLYDKHTCMKIIYIYK